MDEIFEKILFNGYGLKLYSAKRTRTCLVCNTDKGVIALKKRPADHLMVSFEGACREKITQNGFDKINCFIKTVEDEYCFTYLDQTYTAEPYCELSMPDTDDKKVVFSAVETLANMHNAAYGLEFEGGRSTMGRLEELFNKRTAYLRHIRKDIVRRGDYDIMDMIIKNNYDYFINRSVEAIEKLKNSGYEKIVSDSAEKKTFCHNSYKSGNYMVDKNNNIFIESMPKAAYEIPCWDIAFFLRRMMKKPCFDGEYTKKILFIYSNNTAFTKQEEDVVMAVITFPWKFMNLCNEYYNKKRNYCLTPAVERFQRCIEASVNEEKILLGES